MWRAISNSVARDWDASLYFCLSSTENTISRSQWGLEVFLQSLSDLNLSLSEYLLFFQDIMIFPRKETPEERKKKTFLYFQADQILLMDPISGRTLSTWCLEQTDWQSLHQLVWVYFVESGRSVFESALGWVSGLENSWKSFPGNKVLFSYFSLSFYRSSDFWTCQVN